MKNRIAITCALFAAPIFANAMPVTLQMNLAGSGFNTGSLVFSYEEDQPSGPNPYLGKFNWLDARLNFDANQYFLDTETENTMTMHIEPNGGVGPAATRFNAGFVNQFGDKFSLYLGIEDYDYFPAISLPLFKTELTNNESFGFFSNADGIINIFQMSGQLSDITVPEPAPLALLIVSFAGIFFMRKKMKEDNE